MTLKETFTKWISGSSLLPLHSVKVDVGAEGPAYSWRFPWRGSWGLAAWRTQQKSTEKGRESSHPFSLQPSVE